MDKETFNEQSAMKEVIQDQIENDLNDRLQSSPNRQPNENERLNSPSFTESHTEGQHLQSADGHSECIDRQVREVFNLQESEVVTHNSEVAAPIPLESSESAFLCKYSGCNFTTGDAELFLRHEDTHQTIGTIPCDLCNLTFRTYSIMRRHQLYVHQGIRTFECQYCSKRFLRKDQFSEHLSKHVRPRPYQCTFCGETFNFRGLLKTHLNTEHADIAVGKTCHLCNFKASSPSAIKVHYATFHLTQNMEMSDGELRRVHGEIFGNSLAQVNPTENGAIDLATVSQNFSYMPHYPSFSMPVTNGSAIIPGPSDLSCRSKARRASSPIPNTHNVAAQASDQNVMSQQEDDSRHTCVTSLAGSTVLSPSMCQDRSCHHHEPPVRHRMCIKPEPSDLTVDDSQNSNVQPTSTMDLSTSEVVETTCGNSEASGSSETLCIRKVHKHSSSDDTGSESHNSPSNRLCVDSQANARTAHTCFRYRPYEEGSSQRCREYSRHTCVSHRRNPERRARFSDSDVDRTAQNDQSDGEERKIFYSRATSTNNSLVPGEIHYPPRSNQTTGFHNEGTSCTSVPQGASNYFGRKNIVIRDIESCTLTCTFCGIIFPDQTLYLLHRSLHSESSPWKCNLCGKTCKDKYDFNSHIISKGHY